MDLQTIYFNLPAKKADLILLVLASQNIDVRTQKNEAGYDILVDTRQAETAVNAVHQYSAENRFFRIHRQLEAIPVSSFFSPAAFMIMGILSAIHAAGIYYHIHETLVLKCGASALYILQGENYRAVTALFLHADIQHLLGNLAGILIFAAPVVRIFGYGTGPFVLLLCGAAGNLLNAHLYQTAHLSIGSSTAIMAAAGLLCTFQAISRSHSFKPGTLIPIFSGAVLVGLFSQGDNTDVWAHIFGFMCGLLSGAVFFPLNRIIQSPLKQPVALLSALLITLSAAWAAI